MKKIFFLLLITSMTGRLISQNLANFTQVGPVKFPDNPSVQTTGMGRVSQLVYHPTDSNIMFAVSASGGVFKSSNEGVSWKPISDNLPQTACASLAINPLKPSTMFLGTGDANYGSGGLGVWKTTNGGVTWVQSTSGIGNRLVSKILFFPTDTQTLIAACSDGIYKSTNGGSTWVKKTTTTTNYRDLCFRPQSNTILYASSNNNFYRSYDTGQTWLSTVINSAISITGINIAVCKSDTSKIYLLACKTATNPFGGIYKSVNNGSSFTLQSDTPNILGYSNNGSSMDGQGAYNLALAVDPNNSNILYIGAINIWKSSNGGSTFTLKSHWAYGVHADKHGFLFSPYNPNKLYIFHDGGLDRSLDSGNTWQTLEDGLSASEFYKMASSRIYNGYLIGGLQDNGKDVSIDKNFATVGGGDWSGDFVFDAFDSTLLYENGGVRRNLITRVTGIINGQAGVYAIHPNDSNVLFEAKTDLYRTNNVRSIPSNGVIWTKLSSFTGTTSGTYNCLSYSKMSSGTLYVNFSPQKFYRSEDINSAAPIFTQITSFPFNANEQIKQIETCDYDSNTVYVITSQSRILKSIDKGKTWMILTRNLPANQFIKIVLDQKNQDSSIYLCTALNVYYRNKNLNNWIIFSKGLPTVAQISDLDIMCDGSVNSRLFISTYGRGIWFSDLYKTDSLPPVADFTIQPISQSCPNSLILVDNSRQSPGSRKWQIFPAAGWKYLNGTDSLSSRAEIQLTNTGEFYISLTVTNTKGSNTKTTYYNYSLQSVASSCNTTTNKLGAYTIGIYNFEFNTINKTSATGNTSYEDFSCTSSTVIRPGASYTASVTNGNSYIENGKIYIDYNNNGSFTDANELVGTISDGKGKRSCTITILSNPPVMNSFIRMRVISDVNPISGPCGNLEYGQSEDYSVKIDNTSPTVSIGIPKPVVSSSFNAVFTVSEYVNDFDLNDITVKNGFLLNFSQINYNTYSAKITPVNNGMVSLKVIANSMRDMAGNLNAQSSDSLQFFLGFKTFTFSGISIKDSIIQTPAGGQINCLIPYPAYTDTLVSTFTLSDSSIAYINGVKQVSGLTKNNFKNNLIYEIRSKDNAIAKAYPISISLDKNTDCKLISFGFVTPAVSGIITQTTGVDTVKITVPVGTNLSNLVSWFVLSDSAKAYINAIRQISNVSTNNYTTSKTLKVYAQDTNYSKTYLITVLFGKSNSCDILGYSLQSPAVVGSIKPSPTGGDIKLLLPFGSVLGNHVGVFTLSDSSVAYINLQKQQSGITQNDYRNTLTYKVIAQDTNYKKTYLVKTTVGLNPEAKLLSYSILNPSASGTITTTSWGGIVTISVPFRTNINNLTAQFLLSDSARGLVNNIIQVSGITSNSFEDTLLFKVLAQDGVNFSLYKIRVQVSPNNQCDMLNFQFNNPLAIGTLIQTFNGGTVDLIVPATTNLNSLIASFKLSDSAFCTVSNIIQISGSTINNFSSPLNYLVKAQNLINTKIYTVTVSKYTGLSNSPDKMNELRIYPNPAKNWLNIEYKVLPLKTEFSIENQLGQMVIKGEISGLNSLIDISHLAGGIYHLNIPFKDGHCVQKIIKE